MVTSFINYITIASIIGKCKKKPNSGASGVKNLCNLKVEARGFQKLRYALKIRSCGRLTKYFMYAMMSFRHQDVTIEPGNIPATVILPQTHLQVLVFQYQTLAPWTLRVTPGLCCNGADPCIDQGWFTQFNWGIGGSLTSYMVRVSI